MAGQSQNTHADWPRLAEAGAWRPPSGRIRAGGRVGVSALGGSPCAQLSLVGHRCRGEECGEMHGEVQARCREEVCSSAVCWLVARCSRFRTRCSLLSPPSSVALLECGESTPSSELTHSVVGPLSPAAIRRTVRTARAVRAAVRAAVLTTSRCVATCCLALDRSHSITDCHPERA